MPVLAILFLFFSTFEDQVLTSYGSENTNSGFWQHHDHDEFDHHGHLDHHDHGHYRRHHDAVPPPKVWACCLPAKTECENRAEPNAFFSCRIIMNILMMMRIMMIMMVRMMLIMMRMMIRMMMMMMMKMIKIIYLSRLRQYLSLVSPANGKYSWQTLEQQYLWQIWKCWWQIFLANLADIFGKLTNNNIYGKSGKYL